MHINKLCLGTVQFGMNYGINNIYGKPGKKDVFTMLDKAIEQGIEYYDTACAYGDAESLLGEYEIKRYDVKVITKLKPNLIEDNDPNTASIIEKEIIQSLRRLRLDALDGYLLHTPTNFYNERIMEALQQCKHKKLVRNIGVSIYETNHALDAVKSGLVDYIQIPYNVFDQRMDRTDFFHLAKHNHVKVFARSAFLQGLLLMEEDKIPAHLSEAKIYLKELDQIIGKYGFSRIQAAFLFTYTHPDVDYLVFGVDTVEQLQEDIALSNAHNDFQTCREEIGTQFRNVSKSIIFPSLWKK